MSMKALWALWVGGGKQFHIPIYTHNRLTLDCPNPKVRITWGMTMFVVPRDRPHSRPEFRPHRREGGEQHVRESRSEPDSLGGCITVSAWGAP